MNEGRLIFPDMEVEKTPFSVHSNTHTIDLSNTKVLLRPEQAEGAEGKNVVFGETRPKSVNDKILAREMVLEKAPDGKELIKITVKAKVPGGQKSSSAAASRPAVQDRPVRPVSPRADRGLSSPSVRKRVLGSKMCQRSKGRWLLRNQPLASF